MNRPIALVVGAASRDVTAEDPRGWRLGGAVMFAAIALARLGVDVRALIGADREAAAASELELLRSAGVAMAIAHLESGPVFDNVEHLYLAACDRITPSSIPRRWTSGFDAVLFAPVAAEVGDDWADMVTSDPAPVVALGWQGLLRVLEPNTLIRPRPPWSSPLVRAAQLVVVSEVDIAGAMRPEDVRALLRPDATLVWTEGERGGIVFGTSVDGQVAAPRRFPAIPSDGLVDPTGAGDVFLASMLAATLIPSLGDPLVVAAAAASLTVEGPGLLGVSDLAAVRRRMTRAPSRASLRPSATSSRTSGRPSQA